MPTAPPAPRRILLVRHGETAANVAGRFLGRSDPPLTAAGRGAALGLAPLVAAFAPDSTISSPALRARDTAAVLGTENPVIDARLREVDFGRWEGLTPAEAAARDPDLHRAFVRGDIFGFPEGETVATAADRILSGIAALGSARSVVVTHATVIRIAVSALLGLPPNRYRSLLGRPDNCSATELEFDDGVWRLLRYSVRALPAESTL